jgi:hypothetical protein
MKNKILFIIIALFLLVSCAEEKHNSEISVDKAIQIAKSEAHKRKYTTLMTGIEVLIVKKKYANGPIRMSWLIHHCTEEKLNILLKKEFWIIYFYPKEQMERPHLLGGDFFVAVDLYSGKVLAVHEGQ